MCDRDTQGNAVESDLDIMMMARQFSGLFDGKLSTKYGESAPMIFGTGIGELGRHSNGHSSFSGPPPLRWPYTFTMDNKPAMLHMFSLQLMAATLFDSQDTRSRPLLT